jgi:hypothetical protein
MERLGDREVFSVAYLAEAIETSRPKMAIAVMVGTDQSYGACSGS